MNRIEIIKKTLIIASIIKCKGGSIQNITSLIHNNPELLKMSTEELQRQLHLIVNNNITYAILLIIDNEYKWSVLKDIGFGPFITSDAIQKNNDYIVEMIINSIEKFTQYADIDENDTLEEKVEYFSRIRKNEDGYHLK